MLHKVFSARFLATTAISLCTVFSLSSEVVYGMKNEDEKQPRNSTQKKTQKKGRDSKIESNTITTSNSSQEIDSWILAKSNYTHLSTEEMHKELHNKAMEQLKLASMFKNSKDRTFKSQTNKNLVVLSEEECEQNATLHLFNGSTILLNLLEEGYGDAAIELCRMNMAGLYLKNDSSNYLDILEKTAEMGHVNSMFFLGEIYSTGQEKLRVQKNLKKAEEWYLKAKNKGDVAASNNLGYLYREGGEGFEKNVKEALNCFHFAFKNGVNEAGYGIAQLYHFGSGDDFKPNIKGAIQFYEAVIKRNFLPACVPLGNIYHFGIEGIELNFKKAKELYEKAGNDELALTYLGLMHYNGQGVKQDFKKAIEFYEKSSSCILSIHNLAWMYHQGQGCKRDIKKAVEFYQKGVKLNDPHCAYQLGVISQYGIGGIVRNKEQALEYYTQALKLVMNSGTSQEETLFMEKLIQIRIDQVKTSLIKKEERKKKKQELRAQTVKKILELENERKKKQQELEKQRMERLEKSKKQNPTPFISGNSLSQFSLESNKKEEEKEERDEILKNNKEILLRKQMKEELKRQKERMPVIENNNNQNLGNQDEEDSSEEALENRFEDLKNNNHKKIVRGLFETFLKGDLVSNKVTHKELELILGDLDPNYTLKSGPHVNFRVEDGKKFENGGLFTVPHPHDSPYVKPAYLRNFIDMLIVYNCIPPECEDELIEKWHLPQKNKKK